MRALSRSARAKEATLPPSSPLRVRLTDLLGQGGDQCLHRLLVEVATQCEPHLQLLVLGRALDQRRVAPGREPGAVIARDTLDDAVVAALDENVGDHG